MPDFTLEQVAFVAVAAMVVIPAVLVVTVRNIFHSVLFLAFSFLGVAGVFLFLGADFLAAVQVLVYIGAIIILMMFALMLTHRVMTTNVTQTIGQWWLAFPVAVGVLTLLFRVFVSRQWGMEPHRLAPTTGVIGTSLLTKWVLPFELASVVLLVAMIGAIILAKEDKTDGPA